MQHQHHSPVSTLERIQTIDIIRGFALLGIIIVNFTVDNAGLGPQNGWTGLGDQIAYWFIKFFLNDKFMAIYCLLFGLGFTFQMFKAKERNSSFVFVYIRRMIVLYLIGAINLVFCYGWDILETYAIAGLLLLIVYKLPRKLLPALALLCVLVPWSIDAFKQKKTAAASYQPTISVDTAVLDSYVGVYYNDRFIILRKGTNLIYETPTTTFPLVAKSDSEFLAPMSRERLIFKKDSIGKINRYILYTRVGKEIIFKKNQKNVQKSLEELLKQRHQIRSDLKGKTYMQFINRNFNNFWSSIKNWSLIDFFRDYENRMVIAIFLFGLYAGKRKVFYDITENRSYFSKVMKWGLLIGAICTAITIAFQAWNYIHDISRDSYSPRILDINYLIEAFPGAAGMALGYVAGMALLLEKDSWKKKLAFLQPVGRLGLTNYLIQGIGFTFLFRSFGLGLDIGAFWRTMLALLFFTIIIFTSRLWLKHFRYGPFEWLWRSLTYLKFQPMRIKTRISNLDSETLSQ